MSRESFVYGRDEVGGQARFDDVSCATRLQCGPYVIRIFVHGQEHKLCAAAGVLEAPGCFDAIQTRHSDVEHDRIGVELYRCLDEVRAVADRADNLELARQHIARLCQDFCMIVRQQYTRDFGLSIHNADGIVGPTGSNAYCQS